PWQALQAHRARIAPRHLRDLFAEDPDRFARFSLSLPGMLADFSKNLVTDETLHHLVALARESGLEDLRADLFGGQRINTTENRAVLHMALRATAADSF